MPLETILPTIVGPPGPLLVKEGESGKSTMRLRALLVVDGLFQHPVETLQRNVSMSLGRVDARQRHFTHEEWVRLRDLTRDRYAFNGMVTRRASHFDTPAVRSRSRNVPRQEHRHLSRLDRMRFVVEAV